MEGGARSPLDAVGRPHAPAGLEVLRTGRMPVTRSEHRRAGCTEPLRIHIEDGHHRVAVGHAERTAGAEVVLHVDDDEGIARGIDRESHRRES